MIINFLQIINYIYVLKKKKKKKKNPHIEASYKNKKSVRKGYESQVYNKWKKEQKKNEEEEENHKSLQQMKKNKKSTWILQKHGVKTS